MGFSRIWNKLFGSPVLDVPQGVPEPTGPVEDLTKPETWKYQGPNKDLAPFIVGAFASKTRKFFILRHEGNIPVMRANQSIDLWKELEYGVHPKAIEAHCIAIKNLIAPKKPIHENEKNAKLYLLAERMLERIALNTSLTLSLSLATIRYFDETEDIEGYDWDYNAEKKRFWMENHDVPDFFLNLPLSSFTTSFQGLEANLSGFLTGEAVLIKSHLKVLQSSIESQEPNSDLMKWLTTQIDELERVIDWSKRGFTNTIFTSTISNAT